MKLSSPLPPSMMPNSNSNIEEEISLLVAVRNAVAQWTAVVKKQQQSSTTSLKSLDESNNVNEIKTKIMKCNSHKKKEKIEEQKRLIEIELDSSSKLQEDKQIIESNFQSNTNLMKTIFYTVTITVAIISIHQIIRMGSNK